MSTNLRSNSLVMRMRLKMSIVSLDRNEIVDEKDVSTENSTEDVSENNSDNNTDNNSDNNTDNSSDIGQEDINNYNSNIDDHH